MYTQFKSPATVAINGRTVPVYYAVCFPLGWYCIHTTYIRTSHFHPPPLLLLPSHPCFLPSPQSTTAHHAPSARLIRSVAPATSSRPALASINAPRVSSPTAIHKQHCCCSLSFVLFLTQYLQTLIAFPWISEKRLGLHTFVPAARCAERKNRDTHPIAL